MTSVRRRIAFTSALVALSFLVYLPVLDAYFVGDDFEGILEVVRRGSFGSFEHSGGNFRPVAWLTLAVDHWLWGNDPLGFHLFNVLAHGANAVLVAAVARALAQRLWTTTAPSSLDRLAAIAGLVFVVMPSHTEAVSWIAGRGDVVMTGCSLVAILCWLRGDGGDDAESGRAAVWRVASCGALAAALLTKESAVAVPLVVSTYEVLASGALRRGHLRWRVAARNVASTWPLYLAVVGFLVVRRVVRGNFVDGYGDQYENDGPVRLVAKVGVAVVRSLLPGLPLAGWILLIGLAGVAVVVAGVVLRSDVRRPRTGGAFSLVAFLGSAVVVCVLPMAPSGVDVRTTAGERLVYLPSVFAVIGVAVLLTLLAERNRRVGLVAVASVTAIAIVSLVVVNRVWIDAGRTSEQLVSDAATWRPDDRVVLLNSPDSIRGAYVARNAMAGSMALIHGWESPEVFEVAGVLVTGPTDRVSVGPGSCARCLRIRLLEPDSSFVRVATDGSEWAIDGIVATEVSDRELDVRFDAPSSGPDYDIWYLDDGRLVRAVLGE